MNWIPNILNQRIPQGGFGRNLTSTECAKLRKHGHKCSTRWIVLRHANSPTFGILYYPSKSSDGYVNANIYVTH